MTIKQIYENLLHAKRAIDFFGKVASDNELKKKYWQYAKQIHPDLVSSAEQYIAHEAATLLNTLYEQAREELEQGIYEMVDPVQVYKHTSPLFEIKIKEKVYQFYENVFEGEVAYIFKGICDDDAVFLKVAIDPDDNALINTEYQVLSETRHQSLPYVEHKIMVNDTNAILMRSE